LRIEREAGFTLLELIVVVVIMGLMLGLVLSNGPMRSKRLAEAAAVRNMVQGLRDAAARAIAQDRMTVFRLDPSSGVWREGTRHGLIPASTHVGFHGVTAQRIGAITFAPDGSASGGTITLARAGAADVQVITVDWLTGRIRVDAPKSR